MTQMLGEELSGQVQGILPFHVVAPERHSTAMPSIGIWFTTIPDAAVVVSEILIKISHYFIDLKKAPPLAHRCYQWPYGRTDHRSRCPVRRCGMSSLISAMYQPLRDAMNTPEGEERINAQYGRDRARMLRAVFAEITRDYRELSLGLSPQPVEASSTIPPGRGKVLRCNPVPSSNAKCCV